MKLILPFPPSVNTYWRHPNKGAFAGKSLISAAGRKFQSAACAAIVEQLRRLPKPTSAPASVEIVLFPPDMLPAPKGKRFTMTEQQTLLSHGVATAYVESGVLRIQRDVTTYRKNAYGVADNSYLDSETLHTSAYVLRKLKSVITSKYGRHKLASDGTRFGPGQAIVTPAVIKGELLATYRQLERAGIVENYELFKQYLVVERDASDPNRLNTLFPPDYVNQLRVFAVVNQFRLQYSEESA